MRRIVSSLGLASALLAANASAQTPTQPLRAFPSAEVSVPSPKVDAAGA